METLTRLLFLVGIGVLGLSAYLFLDTQQNSNFPAGSFAARIDGPVRLAIVGDAEQSESFRAALEELDKGGVIARDEIPADFASSDAIVFFLNGWEEIQQAPWQAQLESDYKIVAETDEDSFSISMEDGAVYRTYFNVADDPSWPNQCYATLVLRGLGDAPGQPIVLPDAC